MKSVKLTEKSVMDQTNADRPAVRPKAILFDMDGTLTEPVLDFREIKRAMGVGPGPILESLAVMDAARRKEAEAILHHYEDQAAQESTLNPGCDELIAWVRTQKLRTALITRNSRKSVASVLAKHGLDFEVLITREDGKFKPDPEPLLLACRKLGVDPSEAWMVGDGNHDCAAGAAAGIRTVWISHNRERDFPDVPWRTVAGLPELLKLLCDCPA